LAEARGPERGDVIEFSYLWAHERAAGLLESVKDRRCVIVAVLEGGRRVAVMPITGGEPAHDDKIPLPGGALGLERPSWMSRLSSTSPAGPPTICARRASRSGLGGATVACPTRCAGAWPTPRRP